MNKERKCQWHYRYKNMFNLFKKRPTGYETDNNAKLYKNTSNNTFDESEEEFNSTYYSENKKLLADKSVVFDHEKYISERDKIDGWMSSEARKEMEATANSDRPEAVYARQGLMMIDMQNKHNAVVADEFWNISLKLLSLYREYCTEKEMLKWKKSLFKMMKKPPKNITPIQFAGVGLALSIPYAVCKDIFPANGVELLEKYGTILDYKPVCDCDINEGVVKTAPEKYMLLYNNTYQLHALEYTMEYIKENYKTEKELQQIYAIALHTLCDAVLSCIPYVGAKYNFNDSYIISDELRTKTISTYIGRLKSEMNSLGLREFKKVNFSEDEIDVLRFTCLYHSATWSSLHYVLNFYIGICDEIGFGKKIIEVPESWLKSRAKSERQFVDEDDKELNITATNLTNYDVLIYNFIGGFCGFLMESMEKYAIYRKEIKEEYGIDKLSSYLYAYNQYVYRTMFPSGNSVCKKLGFRLKENSDLPYAIDKERFYAISKQLFKEA